MFSNKIKVVLNKKVKVNKYLLLLFDSFSFFIFHSLFFQYFSFVSCYVKTFYVFWEDLFFIFVFKESTLQYLKKIQVQIISNEKAVVKVSRTSNSKSPSWKLLKLRSEFFLVNVLRISRHQLRDARECLTRLITKDEYTHFRRFDIIIHHQLKHDYLVGWVTHSQCVPQLMMT